MSWAHWLRIASVALFFSVAMSFSIAIDECRAERPVAITANSDREQANYAKVETVLAMQVSFEVKGMPLKDLIQKISIDSDLTVHLSRKLEDAGVQRDTPVTVTARNISLEAALHNFLDDLNLTFLVKNESLTITTVEDAQSPENMVLRIYPVLDLIQTADGHDFDPLVDLITSNIEPDSWQDVGGPGSISPHYNSASLVISQRWDIHRRTEALLSTLRKVRGIQNVTAFTIPAKPRRK